MSGGRARRRAAAVLRAAAAAVAVGGCGSGATERPPSSPVGGGGKAGAIPPALMRSARPIGRGARFTPTLRGEPEGRCAQTFGLREESHVELFAQNRVVLLAAGIGTRAPRRFIDGRLTHAACFGEAVTLDPTGTVYFRTGVTVTLRELFAEWGQSLTSRQLASFAGGTVRAYVDGRARPGPAGSLRLTSGAEIVLEIGPYVPPHRSFPFPRPPGPDLT